MRCVLVAGAVRGAADLPAGAARGLCTLQKTALAGQKYRGAAMAWHLLLVWAT